jgi:hypothetical protein
MEKEINLGEVCSCEDKLSEKRELIQTKTVDGSDFHIQILIRCIGQRCFESYLTTQTGPDNSICLHQSLEGDEATKFDEEWNRKWQRDMPIVSQSAPANQESFFRNILNYFSFD